MSQEQTAVAVVASFTPRPGASQEVQRILEGMVAPSRAEPGCERYELYEGEKGFHLIERYRDGEALAAHRATDHYQGYRAAIGEHLEGEIAVLKMTPIDTAG